MDDASGFFLQGLAPGIAVSSEGCHGTGVEAVMETKRKIGSGR